jgi:hypothetical protein
VLAESADAESSQIATQMGNPAFPEQHIRTTNRNIWILLTSVFTFISGMRASQDDWPVFWVMVALWIFTGALLAACRPGLKRGR